MMSLLNAKEKELYNLDNELRNQIDVTDRLVAQLRGTIAELDAKLKKSHEIIEEKKKEDQIAQFNSLKFPIHLQEKELQKIAADFDKKKLDQTIQAVIKASRESKKVINFPLRIVDIL